MPPAEVAASYTGSPDANPAPKPVMPAPNIKAFFLAADSMSYPCCVSVIHGDRQWPGINRFMKNRHAWYARKKRSLILP